MEMKDHFEATIENQIITAIKQTKNFVPNFVKIP